jgi:hypothetical protein
MSNGIEVAQSKAKIILDNVAQVIIGKREVIELAVIALISKGHLLIEDAPGVGKTMLARSLAKSLDCTFKRIQFTPDMLPSDITGVSVYNQKTGDFEFRPGPVMAQIVLADEINRATPKVQSALLECMEEGQITIDGITHKMPDPFHVLATQNPIEYEGTFPLPETQLDRFLMRINLGYPSTADEITIMNHQQYHHPIDNLQPGDRVLMCEACSHHPIGEDIGRVKLPRWLRQYVGGKLEFTHVQGHDFPDDLSQYKLVVHCGACMWNRREVLSRVLRCQQAGMPITNYGLAIAYSLGIFQRALGPFPAAL